MLTDKPAVKIESQHIPTACNSLDSTGQFMPAGRTAAAGAVIAMAQTTADGGCDRDHHGSRRLVSARVPI